jgi:hypothetical protein
MKCLPNNNAFAMTTDDEDFNGLTKREYFAGLALQGLCLRYGIDYLANFEMAKFSVHMADMLIEELNK